MLVTSFAIFEISRSNSGTDKFVSLLQCLRSKCQILIFDFWSGLTDLFSGLTDIWPFQPLTIITKRSILDVAAAQDLPSLFTFLKYSWNNKVFKKLWKLNIPKSQKLKKRLFVSFNS